MTQDVDTSRAESLATAQRNALWEHLEMTQVLSNLEPVELDAACWEAFEYRYTSLKELVGQTEIDVEMQGMYLQH